MNLALWDILKTLREEYDWVELSYAVSPETPHYHLFPALKVEQLLNIAEHGAASQCYSLVSQYGTHVDPPSHFIEGGRALHEIGLSEMAFPLCVVDVKAKADQDYNYSMTKQDLLDWEAQYGEIPAGSFVAMYTGWAKRIEAGEDLKDAEGNDQYPGWGLDAVEFLLEERKVAAIGHEPADTDAAPTVRTVGWKAEKYLLSKDHIQIELLRNLDQLPPKGALFFCSFPQLVGGTGFTARCFAIKPR